MGRVSSGIIISMSCPRSARALANRQTKRAPPPVPGLWLGKAIFKVASHLLYTALHIMRLGR